MIQDNDTILENYLEICSEAYSLLQEENRLLKKEASLPEAFLQKKELLLDRLKPSTTLLKSLQRPDTGLTRYTQQLSTTIQNKLMKILLLDRENEQLLLKNAVLQTAPLTERSYSSETIETTYVDIEKSKPKPTFNTVISQMEENLEESQLCTGV